MTSKITKKIDVKKALSYVRRYGGEVDNVRLQHFLGEMNFSEAEKSSLSISFRMVDGTTKMILQKLCR